MKSKELKQIAKDCGLRQEDVHLLTAAVENGLIPDGCKFGDAMRIIGALYRRIEKKAVFAQVVEALKGAVHYENAVWKNPQALDAALAALAAAQTIPSGKKEGK